MRFLNEKKLFTGTEIWECPCELVPPFKLANWPPTAVPWQLVDCIVSVKLLAKINCPLSEGVHGKFPYFLFIFAVGWGGRGY